MGSSGRFTASTNSALRRSIRRALPYSTGLRRRADSSRWYSTASVTTCTRYPAPWTRQQKSTSSRNSLSLVSNPPSWSQTSRLTSMPAEPTASTAFLWSCWPWSISPGSMPVIAAASAVDRDARLAERPAILAVEHLRPEYRDGAVPARRPQQPLQGIGGGLAVVVQQPDPVDPVDVRVGPSGTALGRVPESDRDRLAVAGGPVHAEHRVLRRSARPGRPRCDRGSPCPRRRSARPGRSAPGVPGRGRAASERRRARRRSR